MRRYQVQALCPDYGWFNIDVDYLHYSTAFTSMVMYLNGGGYAARIVTVWNDEFTISFEN